MFPYGLQRGDRTCCPGHDKYPGRERRRKKNSNYRNALRAMKRLARRVNKALTREDV